MQSYTALSRVYDRLITPEERAMWDRDIPARLREEKILPGSRVADVGCGTGRMAAAMTRAGYRVTGFDLSEDMLREAQALARRGGVPVVFVRQDMRELEVPRPVHCVLCLCDGLNYLTTPGDVKKALKAAFDALRPGGLYLADFSSRARLRAMGGQFFGDEEEDVAYLWENTWDDASACITMDVTLFIREDAERDLFLRRNEVHVQRGHTADELRAWLAEVGFTDIRVEEAFTRHAPDDTSDRIQILARRP